MIDRKKLKNVGKIKDLASSLSQEDHVKFLDFLKFQSLFQRLKKSYGVSDFELIKKLEEDVLIPATIFNEKLGSLEAICKYLKENLNFSNKRIALLIGRDSKSVWQAYNSSKNKFPNKIEIFPSKYFIPISILKNKKLGVLENIVVFLRDEFEISYHKIAVLLKRDDRTIWTVYQKAREKYAKK